VRGRRFPIVVGYLAYPSAILLVVLHLCPLIVLDPTRPGILLPELLKGFLINPAFYLMVGMALLSGRGASTE
jgi:hypothetical protein